MVGNHWVWNIGGRACDFSDFKLTGKKWRAIGSGSANSDTQQRRQVLLKNTESVSSLGLHWSLGTPFSLESRAKLVLV